MIGVVPGVVPGEVVPQIEQVIPGNAVIRTKLEIPKVQPMWVARPRLNQRLDVGLQRPLTLLSAPAGFGKTALLTEWCSTKLETMPVAWFSLDERDSDPARFAAHFYAALRSAGVIPESGSYSVDLAERDLISLVNQIHEFPQDFALVLDDYHLISDPQIHQALEFLLEFIPNHMHLVLSSRVDPPLPLAQLRARGQLVELRTPEMRFTHQEVDAFLNQKLALNLQPEAITSLEIQSEGWIAGLYLAALSIRDEGGPSQPISGSHPFIVDYLVEQVFDHQTPAVQKFLLDTAVAERLCAELCNQLTGLDDSQTMLEILESENLFLVHLDGNRRWYRYHPLFADFLRQRLRRKDFQRWVALHEHAMGWYERNGYFAEAVEHALKAAGNEKTLSLLDRGAEVVWGQGEIDRLPAWFEALPQELIRSKPKLCLYYAWSAISRGDVKLGSSLLQSAKGALQEQEDSQAAELQGILHTMRAMLAIMENDPKSAVYHSSHALAHLPEEMTAWRALAASNQGLAQLYHGKTHQAIRSLQQADEISKRSGNLYIQLWTSYAQTELHLLRGRISAVERLCREVFEVLGEREREFPALSSLYHLALSEAYRLRNELAASLEQVDLSIELAKLGEHECQILASLTQRGLILRALGQSAKADQAFQQAHAYNASQSHSCFWLPKRLHMHLQAQHSDPFTIEIWLQENSHKPEDSASVLAGPGYLFQSRFLIQDRQWEQAQHILDLLQASARNARLFGLLGEILALRALAFWAQNKKGCAFRAINQALHLAEPESNFRVFLDEGPLMHTLVTEFGRVLVTKNHIDRRKRIRFIEVLLRNFQPSRVQTDKNEASDFNRQIENPVDTDGNESLVDPLSVREIEVLSLIAEGMPNRSIAKQLVLAPSTVHWHTKNIYSKLNVHNRTQAVFRARELAVIP
jgi:LuxR family maltose regulon positive regulatory protein